MTVPATDPAILPQFAGKPVPWVTRWTDENLGLRYGVQQTRAGLRTTYGDDNEDRDEFGVLWQKEGITKKGRPEWARVSTYRQRSAMRKRRCQVCGQKITSPVIRWLVQPDGVEDLLDEATGLNRSLTTSAPTCDGCVDLSLEVCPNLQRYGYMILKVLEYDIWGVFGEILVPQAVAMAMPPTEHRSPGPMGLWRIQTSIGYHENYGAAFNLGLLVAKQQVVELTKFTVEKYVEGAERPNNFDGPPRWVGAQA